MRAVVAGSGPVGMTAALLLARQGHRVVLVDRDPGPVPGRRWDRVGVMQFRLPHTLRSIGDGVLRERLPDVRAALVSAGGVPAPVGMHIRRSVLEHTLWTATSREPGVERLTGHVDGVAVADRTAVGLVVDGRTVPADLVIDASGRAGRVSSSFRPPARGGPCGFAYACRLYRLHPGASVGPTNGGPGYVAEQHGFLTLLFVHDAGTFTVLFVRRADDHDLAGLREEVAFTAATTVLPPVAAWVDPARSVPIDRVRSGAGLVNRYQAQPRTVSRLLAIGDAACTTNPTGARGLSLGMRSAAALADIVALGGPPGGWAAALDDWSANELRPWFEDMLLWDASMWDRWSGRAVDPDGPIAWDVLAAAAATEPVMMATIGPYLAMHALPGTLEPLRPQVRELLRSGWQPPRPSGPTRDDLAAAVHQALDGHDRSRDQDAA